MIEIIFDQKGDFKALYAFETWCQENDIASGRLCGDLPIGLFWGRETDIAKWRNLFIEDIKALYGRATSRDFRHGPITVQIVERGGGTYDNA